MNPAEAIERLAAVPYSGAISDILDDMGLVNQLLPYELVPQTGAGSIVGRALTVRGEYAPGITQDESIVPYLEMLGSVTTGDVIVSQPNDLTCAHFGELSAETAQARGARGAIIDGGVRDTAYIDRLGFPVFARYRTSRDIVGRWRLVSFNDPIQIGETMVHAGDYIVGDQDSIVVVPSNRVSEVLDAAERVVSTENLVRSDILAGSQPADAYRRHGRF